MIHRVFVRKFSSQSEEFAKHAFKKFNMPTIKWQRVPAPHVRPSCVPKCPEYMNEAIEKSDVASKFHWIAFTMSVVTGFWMAKRCKTEWGFTTGLKFF